MPQNNEFGLKYLKCSATNQDYLERLFDRFRGMLGSCTNPSALQFIFIITRFIGAELSGDAEFDLLSKKGEIEKGHVFEQFETDQALNDIENMLTECLSTNPSVDEGFMHMASSVVEKFKLSHPTLGFETETQPSSSKIMKFSNDYQKGLFLIEFGIVQFWFEFWDP